MDYKKMCVNQGYVPPTCKLDGQMCWLLVKEGKDPCAGCNYNRAECNGRHAPYESESYQFGVLIDAFDKARRKQNEQIRLEKERKELERKHRHSMCNAKNVLSIVTDYNVKGKVEIELKVNNLISERGYVRNFDTIQEMCMWIPAIITKYGVQQIQIDSMGYGIGVYDAIDDLKLDVDIVPIKYSRMNL